VTEPDAIVGAWRVVSATHRGVPIGGVFVFGPGGEGTIRPRAQADGEQVRWELRAEGELTVIDPNEFTGKSHEHTVRAGRDGNALVLMDEGGPVAVTMRLEPHDAEALARAEAAEQEAIGGRERWAKQVTLGLAVYIIDHDGELPAHVGELLAQRYVPVPDREDEHAWVMTPPAEHWEVWQANPKRLRHLLAYKIPAFRRGSTIDRNRDDELVVMMEEPGRPGGGVWIGYADGRAEQVTSRAFATILGRQIEQVDNDNAPARN
jgi:hypothetical protein